jgi:hypothetical protein
LVGYFKSEKNMIAPMRIPAWITKMARRFPEISEVIKRYPPERKLGKGVYKWVYASGEVAVGITSYDKQARDEIRYLARLKKIGLSVVEILEWVQAGRTGNGGALVMRRYRKIHKITDKLRKECEGISKILYNHRITVNDLAVLLDKSGRIVLADPIYICRRRRGDQQVFKFASISGAKVDQTCEMIWM